ncbi:hypothetical protein [Azospirillum brasilense]|uniref:hypothetical protein n=1 Tax=Azospirillum brasilense TaxID=192 RepID=UPI003D7DF341
MAPARRSGHGPDPSQRPHHLDGACETGGETQASVARRFEVLEATVSSWCKQACDTAGA